MHRTLAEIVERVESDRAAVISQSRELTQEQLDFRPDPERWSIGENLDHLALVETGISRLLAMKLAAAKNSMRRADADAPSFATSLDSFVITNNPRKLKVPDERIAPRHGVAKDELFGSLEASRRSVRQSLEPFADQDLSAHTFAHPFLGEINLYQWILFIGQHERRHLNQINDVLAAANFPVSDAAAQSESAARH